MKTQKGFTLIELMIVVAIIGILAAVAIPAYSDYLKRAKVAEAIGLMAGLKTPSEEYYGSKGVWPAGVTTINGKVGGKYTTAIGVNGTGYSASMIDTSITGKVLMGYDPVGKVWSCKSPELNQAYLPTACK